MNAPVRNVQPAAEVHVRQRPRQRAVNLQPTPEQQAAVLSADMVAKVQNFIRLNEAANAANGELRKATKELRDLFVAEGLDGQQIPVTYGEHVYDAGVYGVARDVVDVERLRKEVPDDVFMKIIKAGNGDVEAFAGKVILSKVKVNKVGEPDFRAKKRKN